MWLPRVRISFPLKDRLLSPLIGRFRHSISFYEADMTEDAA